MMNGPAKLAMYKLQPVFTLPETIELPSNMYSLRKVNASGESPIDIVRGIQDKVKKILKQSSSLDTGDLEKRWDLVLLQLAELKSQLADIKKSVNKVTSSSTISSNLEGVQGRKTKPTNQLNTLSGSVIKASPSSPPYSLLLIQQLYKTDVNLKVSTHTHSSVAALPVNMPQFSSISNSNVPELDLLVIWQDGLLDTELTVNPIKQITILGEVNILRYLARLGLEALNYDTDENTQLQNDTILDTCHRLLHVRTAKEKTSIVRSLNAKLGRNMFYGGNGIDICDIAVWSALKQADLYSEKELSQNMAKWFARVESTLTSASD